MADILVIDDDDGVRDMVRVILVREGYSVEVAIDGADGIAKIDADPPRLVITDIIMPEKDGMEAIYELRANHPAIRIVAMSGGGRRSDYDYLDAAQKLGADATLAKPFAGAALIATVRDLLKG